MFLKTPLRQWLLLSVLSIAFAACGGGTEGGNEGTQPCDQAACELLGQTCDHINNVCVDCLDKMDCGTGMVCDRDTKTCVEGECAVDSDCSTGQHCENYLCVTGIDCDAENLCPSHGICGVDGKCLTSSSTKCTSLAENELPANAVEVEANVEITWDPATGWSTPAKCAWECAEGYKTHGNECVEDVATGCDSADDCENADCVDGACVTQKTVSCAEPTDVPENATANATSEVTVNFVEGAWEATPSCGWTCNDGYALNETNDACVETTMTPTCGNGVLEAGEACDTGANAEPIAPVFPESATCTSVMADEKTYTGELACASDCSAIETTNCTEVMTGVETVTCRTSPSSDTLGIGDTVLATINVKVVDAANNVLKSDENAGALFTSAKLYYRAQGTTAWLEAIDFETSTYVAATAEDTDADSYAYSYALKQDALLADGTYDAIWGITYNGTEYFCPAGDVQVAAITDRDAEGVIYSVLTVDSDFCDNSEECGEGMFCTQEGACIEETEPTICLENDCRTTEIGGSEGNEVCQNGVWTSGECTEGSVCTAIPDNSTSGQCVTITPEPECTMDDECAGDLVCVEGACVEATPEPECTADGDCESGLCVEGACATQKTVNCAEPTDVPENATANAAFEVTINFVEGAWATAESCGWTCNNGFTINEAKDACVEQEVIPVFFSEYIEGNDNNKAIEVYNAGESDVSCQVILYSNGSTTGGSPKEITIKAQSTYSLCNSQAVDELKAKCDDPGAGVAGFSGNDALELICNGQTVDIFGTIGESTNWSLNGNATKNMTLRRKCSVTVGVTTNAAGFPSLGTEWDAYEIDTFDGIGSHCDETPASCTTDSECGEGEVCTDGECVAGEDPIVCEEGCGTGDHEGQLCIVDDMNPNGVWTDCANGCAENACIENEINCTTEAEDYCEQLAFENGNEAIWCNETTGQCVECIDNTFCNAGYECNTATNTCQALCGNGAVNEGEECDPNADKSDWLYSTCEAYGAYFDTSMIGEISCSETCELNIVSCDELTAVNWCRLQSHGGAYAVTLDETTTSSDFYGQINVPNVTGNGSGSDKIRGEFIYWDGNNAMQTIAATKTTLDASSGGNDNDQWVATVSLSDFAASGSYNYSWRFTADDGLSWYYCHNENHANSADGGSGAATTSESDVIGENNMITVTKPTATNAHVVINQLMVRGVSGDATDEFIELYNPTNEDIDLSGWVLWKTTGTNWPQSNNGQYRIDLSKTIPANGYFLIVSASSTIASPDLQDAATNGLFAGLNEKAIIMLTNTTTPPTALTDSHVIDVVGMGSGGIYEGSGTATIANKSSDGGKSITRTDGIDTDDNAADFTQLDTACPHSSTSDKSTCLALSN